MRKGYVDCSGGQIHFRHIEGEGVPTVFLHQTASSGRMWEKVMAQLSGRGPLYALDTPGFGGSFDAPESARPSMGDYAGWLGEAIDALGIDRCMLVGHHTGACIGLELATIRPNLVEKLALLGPVPLTKEERVEFSKHFGTPFRPSADGAYLQNNWKYLCDLGADADPLLINREMSDQLRAWWGRVQSYNAVWDQDFLAQYKAIDVPLLIGAAPDDVLRPYLDRAAELRPDAVRIEIKGANYEPDLDAGGVAEGLRAFLYT